tara:strand:+ start:385 stop:714 length:330 start_codon:yes stop_codon:yes gene_type:complete
MLLLFLVACGGTDSAPQGFQHSLMNTLDTDGDHLIDRSEFSRLAEQASEFERYDLNSDQRIDSDELLRSLLAISPSYGKPRRYALDKDAGTWADWEMHAKRNGIPWQSQ